MLPAAITGEVALLHLYMPVSFRVTLWWAPALLAVYGALRRKHLPVVTVALIIAPLIWVAPYLWAWITWSATKCPGWSGSPPTGPAFPVSGYPRPCASH